MEVVEENMEKIIEADCQEGQEGPSSPSSPPSPPTGQKLVELLSQLEERIEKLRKEASRVEEEKEQLLTTLDALKHSEWIAGLKESERDYIKHSVDRLLAHCMTVETAILTNRNLVQEESLNKVNEYIDNLVIESRNDPVAACDRCQVFIGTCSDPDLPSPGYMIDFDFKTAILACTRDDQKRVKKRLQGLLNYFTGVRFTEL